MSNGVLVPIAGAYVDDLHYENPSASIVLINRIPADAETGVLSTTSIALQVISLVSGPVVSAIVWITSAADGLRRPAYNLTGGGFQAGFTGTATLRQSPGSAVNDELDLVIQPTTPFPSIDTVLVEVLAEATSPAVVAIEEMYSFQVADLAGPVLENVLWLNPRECIVRFDEPLAVSGVGGATGVYAYKGGVRVLGADQVQITGAALTSSMVGLWLGLAGSAYPGNNGYREILGVNTTTAVVTLNTSGDAGTLTADDGLDTDDAGIIVNRRDLRATISPYMLEARLSAEGADTGTNSAERIQSTYTPLPTVARELEDDEIGGGYTASHHVHLTWHDDISPRRLYTLRADGLKDTDGNASASSLDFTAPGFGLPAADRRVTFWHPRMIPVEAQTEDMINEQQMRRKAVIFQDLLNQLWLRVDDLQFLYDPYRCPEHLLDQLLYHLGNPFSFPLERAVEKRRLASALFSLYKRVGTAPGIEAMLKALLGWDFEVEQFLDTDVWLLGDPAYGILGYTTILGPSTAWARNSYQIVSPVDLTATQRRIVREVAEWADPINMHLVRIIEPSTADESGAGGESALQWVLGVSALDYSTVLS